MQKSFVKRSLGYALKSGADRPLECSVVPSVELALGGLSDLVPAVYPLLSHKFSGTPNVVSIVSSTLIR